MRSMPSAAAAARMARNGRHDLGMQGAGWAGKLGQVGPGAPSELIQREFQASCHALAILPEAGTRVFLRNKSTLRPSRDPREGGRVPESARLRLPAN